eukprot:tig00000448_g852.t1
MASAGWGPGALLRRLQLGASRRRPAKRAKLLIVGPPSAGKSSLAKQLACGCDSAAGVSVRVGVHVWDAPGGVRATCWDLRGEVSAVPSLPPALASPGCAVLLVFDLRADPEPPAGAGLRAWVHAVRAWAPGAPLLVAGTHWGARGPGPRRRLPRPRPRRRPARPRRLRLRYPRPRSGPLAGGAVTVPPGRGVAGLGEALGALLGALPCASHPCAASWTRLADRLHSLRLSRPGAMTGEGFAAWAARQRGCPPLDELPAALRALASWGACLHLPEARHRVRPGPDPASRAAAHALLLPRSWLPSEVLSCVGRRPPRRRRLERRARPPAPGPAGRAPPRPPPRGCPRLRPAARRRFLPAFLPPPSSRGWRWGGAGAGPLGEGAPCVWATGRWWAGRALALLEAREGALQAELWGDAAAALLAALRRPAAAAAAAYGAAACAEVGLCTACDRQWPLGDLATDSSSEAHDAALCPSCALCGPSEVAVLLGRAPAGKPRTPPAIVSFPSGEGYGVATPVAVRPPDAA